MSKNTHSTRLSEIIVYMYEFLDAGDSYATFEKGSYSIIFVHRQHGQWFMIPFKVANTIQLEDIRRMAVSAYNGMRHGYSAGWSEGKAMVQSQLKDILGIESNDD